MRVFLFFCILWGICGGCRHSGEKCTVVDLKALLSADPREQNLEEFSKEIKMVSLDTAVLVGRIQEVACRDSLLAVIHDGRCTLFDRNGRWIASVGSPGKGPGEYQMPGGVFFKDEHIYIQDQGTRTMLIFDRAGKFLRSFELPGAYHKIVSGPEGGYIGYIPQVTGRERIRLAFFDEESLQDSLLYTRTFQITTLMFFRDEGRFYSKGKEIFFKEYLNDTIFQVEGRALKGRYFLDLGEKRSRPEARTEKMSMNDIYFKDMVKVDVIGESDRYLFLRISGSIYYFDKQEQVVHKVKFKLPETSFYPFWMSADNKYLIGWQEGKENANPSVILVATD